MKKFCSAIITLGILFGVTYGISNVTSSSMIDWAFFVGLLLSVIIFFFSSSGGIMSNSIHLSVQSRTGVRQEIEKRKFSKSTSFYISIGYTILAFILMVIVYWNNFF